MRAIRAMLMVAVLATGSSCARPDWIEQTLVTVDVTGVWYGTEQGQSANVNFALWLDLQQEGPKAKGYAKVEGGWTNSGPVEGTIAGDVFSFRRSDLGPVLQGELTVSGDEMTGNVTLGGHRITRLRRVGPSFQPDPPAR